jgi:hypothetical protein
LLVIPCVGRLLRSDLPTPRRRRHATQAFGRIPLTNADQLRLNLIAGLTNSPQPAADRLVPADAAARIEPTVTQPFDAIEEHVGSIYRYALRLTRRPDLAEDLTQETLLRGWRSWQGTQAARSVPARRTRGPTPRGSPDTPRPKRRPRRSTRFAWSGYCESRRCFAAASAGRRFRAQVRAFARFLWS